MLKEEVWSIDTFCAWFPTRACFGGCASRMFAEPDERRENGGCVYYSDIYTLVFSTSLHSIPFQTRS